MTKKLAQKRNKFTPKIFGIYQCKTSKHKRRCYIEEAGAKVKQLEYGGRVRISGKHR